MHPRVKYYTNYTLHVLPLTRGLSSMDADNLSLFLMMICLFVPVLQSNDIIYVYICVMITSLISK